MKIKNCGGFHLRSFFTFNKNIDIKCRFFVKLAVYKNLKKYYNKLLCKI